MFFLILKKLPACFELKGSLILEKEKVIIVNSNVKES